MAEKVNITLPERIKTKDFLRGQASIILRKNAEDDSIVVVTRNGNEQNVIISYERYERMIRSGKVDL